MEIILLVLLIIIVIIDIITHFRDANDSDEFTEPLIHLEESEFEEDNEFIEDTKPKKYPPINKWD